MSNRDREKHAGCGRPALIGVYSVLFLAPVFVTECAAVGKKEGSCSGWHATLFGHVQLRRLLSLGLGSRLATGIYPAAFRLDEPLEDCKADIVPQA